MPIADKKKCQTFINVVAEEVVKLQAVADRLEALRTLWTTHNPDTVGTPLDGHLGTVSAWIDDVRAVADNGVANGFIANVVESHRNKALGEEV